MTVQKAKVIFATHMQAARKRKLTAYELNQLSTARQVLRQSRKPAMNPRTYSQLRREKFQSGDRVYFRSDRKAHGTIHRVNEPSNQYWVKWDDGDYTVVGRNQIRRLLAGPKGKLPNPGKRVLIYGQVDRIYATKKQDHNCDAECKAHGHRYFHDFKSKPKMYGLPDGSILIKS